MVVLLKAMPWHGPTVICGGIVGTRHGVSLLFNSHSVYTI